MMRRPAALLSLFLACSPAAPAPGGGSQPAAGHPGAGTRPAFPRTQLGSVEAGGAKLDVFQLEPIVAGAIGDFDLDLVTGVFPPAIRGWVGIESGQGSVKVRFEKENPTRLHGHPEIPKPLPEGSQFWIEVELANGEKPRKGFGLK